MINFLWDWWYGQCRKKDIDILWPVCKANARDLAHARAAFSEHAHRDKAWLWLGGEHVEKIIDALD